MSHKKSRKVVEKSPLELLLEGSWDNITDPDQDNYHTVSSLLKEIEYFKRAFPSQAEFDIFLDFAKSHFVHEVHEYGTVLTREREYASKFCIVLKGNIQKLQQRSQNDVEAEMRHIELKFCKITQENLENALTNSPVMAPTASIDLNRTGHRKNLTWLGVAEHRLSRQNTGEFNLSGSPNLSRSSSRVLTDLESPKLGNKSMSPNSAQLSPILSPLPEAERRRSPSINLGPILLKSIESDKKRRSTQVRVKVGAVRNSLKMATEIMGRSTAGGSRRSSIGRSHIFSRSNTKNWMADEVDQKPQLNIGLTEREEEEEEEKDSPTNKSNKDDMSPSNKRTNGAFVRYIANKHPEIKHRCLNGNVVLLTNNKTFKQGDWFGESSLKEEQIRESGIIAVSTEEAHILTITREAYKQVMSRLSSQAGATILFFRKIFEKFDDEQLGLFSKNFNKRAFLKGESIYHQGDLADALYIVFSGEVKLFKESFQPASNALSGTLSTFNRTKKKVDLPIASIVEKQSFGEEVLLQHKTRQYSAVVTSPNTEVYYLNLSDYKSIKSGFHIFFKTMKEEAQKRFEWREERSAILVEKQKKEFIRASNHRISLLTVDTSKTTLEGGSTGFFDESPTRVISPIKHTPNSAIIQQQNNNESLNDSECISPLISCKERDERSFISPRNLEAYRKRFSRRLEMTAFLSNGFSGFKESPKKGNDSTSMNLGETMDDFNVRKELKMMNNKPKLSISRVTSPQITPVSSPKVYMPSINSKEDSISPTIEAKKTKEKRINFASVKELHSGKIANFFSSISPKVKQPSGGSHKKNKSLLSQNLNFVETVSNHENSQKKEEMSKLLQFVHYRTTKYKLSPLMEIKVLGKTQGATGNNTPATGDSTSTTTNTTTAGARTGAHHRKSTSAACFSFLVQ